MIKGSHIKNEWIFLVLLGAVVGLCIFVLAELILFFSGFHFYPPLEFFNLDNGYSYNRGHVYSYEAFGIFPLADSQEDTVFPPYPPKEDNEFRIFLFGGSVARQQGLYLDALATDLEQRYPGLNVTFFNYACPSIGTDTIMAFYQDAMLLGPDLILIHAGNNELFEQIYDTPHPFKSHMESVNHRLLLHSRVYQLMSYFLFHVRVSLLPSQREFVDKREEVGNMQAVYQPLQQEEVLGRYEHNLRYMVDLARMYDVPVILSTLTYNRCMNAPDMVVDYDTGSRLLLTQGMRAAAPYLEFDFSRHEYPHAANTLSNAIVKKVAQDKMVGVADVDSKALEAYKPYLTGWELFVDHVHYTNHPKEAYEVSDWFPQEIKSHACYIRYKEQVENGTYDNRSDIPELFTVWNRAFFDEIVTEGILDGHPALSHT